MWKNAKSQFGMGSVILQVHVTGGGRVDRLSAEQCFLVQVLRSGQLNMGIITC